MMDAGYQWVGVVVVWSAGIVVALGFAFAAVMILHHVAIHLWGARLFQPKLHPAFDNRLFRFLARLRFAFRCVFTGFPDKMMTQDGTVTWSRDWLNAQPSGEAETT